MGDCPERQWLRGSSVPGARPRPHRWQPITGPIYREDFPYVDNEHWLCKVILRRSDQGWV
jgi:hypothetical protein